MPTNRSLFYSEPEPEPEPELAPESQLLYAGRNTNVIELTPENFVRNEGGICCLTGIPNSQSNGFVAFYAHWCGHCKQMVDLWDTFASYLKDCDSSRLMVGAFSCANESESNPNYKAIAEALNISGYPTIKYIENGKIMGSYDDERTLSKLLTFLYDKLNIVESDKCKKK